MPRRLIPAFVVYQPRGCSSPINTRTNSESDCYSNTIAHASAYLDGSPDPDPRTGTNTDDACADCYSNTIAHASAYLDGSPDPDPRTGTNTDDACADCYSNTIAHASAYLDGSPDPDPRTGTNTDDACADCYSNTIAHASAYPDVPPDPDPRTGTNTDTPRGSHSATNSYKRPNTHSNYHTNASAAGWLWRWNMAHPY